MNALDQAQTMGGRAAFLKIARDAIGNVIFYGMAAAFIIAIGSYVRWLGVILFGMDALITAVTVAQTGFSSILGLVLLARNVIKGLYKTEDLWWDLASVVVVIECAFHVAYALIMYRYFFGPTSG